MEKKRQLPEDVVEYYIFPPLPSTDQKDRLKQYLEEQLDLYLASCSQLLVDYIWQNDPFKLTTVLEGDLPPHLYGRTSFGDNIEDEWFIVYLLFRITKQFPGVVARVFDSDEEFILIEVAEVLPKWINPDSAENRVYIYNGELHIIPYPQSPAEVSFLPGGTPSVGDGVNCVRNCSRSTLAGSQIQDILRNRINGYPSKIQENFHYAHCYIPANLAAIIEQKPSLVAKGVQSFYYRDPIDLKCCRTMQYFRPGTRVISRVKFTRCLYAQLMQQNFQPDKRSGWVLPSKLNPKYKAHDLGMKLAHGFEIMCAKCASNRSSAGNTKQNRLSASDIRWNRYVTALKEKGYFKGEIEGSVLYEQLLDSAKEFYKSQLQMEQNETSQTPGMEVLDMLDNVEYDIEEKRRNEASLPPPDDDSWLELTPDGLEKFLRAKSGLTMDNGQLSSTNGELSEDRFDLSKVAESMQSFVNKASGVDGAEFPGEDEEEDDDDVQFDSTGFISSMQKMFEFEDNDDVSSSDMSEYDWNDSDDESRPKQLSVRKHVIKPPPRPPPPKSKSKKSTNQQSENSNGSTNQPSVKDYMDIMDRELAKTDVGKSFANGGSSDNVNPDKTKRKPSRNIDDEDDDFVPVNVDLNVVQNMLQSLGAQEGLPGPASNILNSMGIKLPPDADKMTDSNGLNKRKISPDQDSGRSSQDSRRSSQDSRRSSQDSRMSSDAGSQGNKSSRSGSLKDKPVSNSPKQGSGNGPPRPPPRRPKPVQRQMSKESNV